MAQSFVTGGKIILTRKLNPGDTSLYADRDLGIDQGRLYFVNDDQVEWCDFTAVAASGSEFVYSGLTRQLSTTAIPATSGGSGYTWLAASQVILVAMHDQYFNVREGGPFASYTTAQLTARTNKVVGETFFDTTLGSLVYWTGAAYQTFGTGTFVNAATTSSGGVELATDAETIAGTDTGSAGPLVVQPSQAAKNTQSNTFVYGADAGGDDTYVVALVPVLAAYTTGQILQFKPTTANTGACTIDFGPGVKNIKTKDGNDPQTGVIRANSIVTVKYDGTSFVLTDEDFATTANKGIVEMATDGEVTTGTDQERYINPKQAKDTYLMVPDVVTFSRDVSTATGTQSVNHSLGKTPKAILLQMVYGGDSATYSFGSSDLTDNKCVYHLPGEAANTKSTFSIYYGNAAETTAYSGVITTADTTTFTVNWTKSGSPTGTIYIVATLLA